MSNAKLVSEILDGFSNEEVGQAFETVERWDRQGRQIRAWTTPVAVRYEDDWEFIVKADMVELSGDPKEVRYLSALYS